MAVRTRHEERRTLSEPIQPREIDVASVHYVERPRLDRYLVEDRDIVDLSMRDLHERRNVAVPVQQPVQLHRRLALA